MKEATKNSSFPRKRECRPLIFVDACLRLRGQGVIPIVQGFLKCNRCLSLVFITILTGVTADVYADPSWYASYGIGEADAEFPVGQTNPDIPAEAANSWNFDGDAKKMALGYTEDAVSYEIGRQKLDNVAEIEGVTLPDNSIMSADIDIDGYYLAAIGRRATSDTLFVTGRVGYYKWEMQNSETRDGVLTVLKSNDDDFFYGVGIEVAWLSIEYTIFDIDGDDVKTLGASVRYTFK